MNSLEFEKLIRKTFPGINIHFIHNIEESTIQMIFSMEKFAFMELIVYLKYPGEVRLNYYRIDPYSSEAFKKILFWGELPQAESDYDMEFFEKILVNYKSFNKII